MALPPRHSLLLCFYIGAGTMATVLPAMGAQSAKFKLSSPDFPANGQVPEKFVLNIDGCSGENVSPELRWTGVPAGTKSFAITLFDGYGPPSGWWHWIVYDIPGTSNGLPRGAGAQHSGALPAGALGGRNDEGDDFYDGPCPGPGDPPHRYVFTIYALKTDKLSVKASPSGAMLSWKADENMLAKATLIARHKYVYSSLNR